MTQMDQIIRAQGSMDTSEMNGKYLTFWSEHQLFGISIADVVQIVGIQTITEIPEFPLYAKGIINLRGNIIPVIDIRLRLGKPETEYNDRTCIIVININDRYFGFVVDEVDEVTTIDEHQVTPPPKMSSDPTTQYVSGIGQLGDKIVLLVNTSKILGEDDFNALTQG